MQLSLSEHLILGIIAEQARHGYDIEKLIDERGMRKWTEIGFSSIYYLLDKLEAKELVASSAVKGTAKKCYTITPTGTVALRDNTKILLAERRPAHSPLMTGLVTSYLMQSSELKDALGQRLEQLRLDLSAVRSKMQTTTSAPPAAQRLLSLSEILLAAELDWVSKEIERIPS